MWVARPGLSPVMVGRQPELAALRHLLDQVCPAGSPHVALVSGEAGVGKSRLLREFTAALPPATPVLAGQAEEGDLNRPFELLRDAVEPLVGAWDTVPAALAPRVHALGHVLAPLLPVAEHPGDHDHTADELQRAAVELVRHLTAGPPAVLVLEDLHWADADSVALLGRLATTPDLPLLLVGTFRPEDFDRRHPLAALLPALERQRPVLTLSLSRLARHDLAEMLEAVYGRAPSAEAVVALHRRTQGNPFFVEELLATAGTTDPEALARVALPWNAAEAVLRRLDALEPDERAVVEAASVLSSRMPFDLLAAVCGLSEDRLIAALRTLVGRGLLAEVDGDTFSFRHALTREAVAGQLLGRQRRRLHERALAALREAGADDDALLAHHAAGAGRPDELVVHARAGALRCLRDGAATLALRLAELGVVGAGELTAPSLDDELALRSLAARAAQRIGLYDLSARHAEQWRVLAAEAGDVAEEASALRLAALVRYYAGDLDGYWARIDEAQVVAERLGPSEELAWCLAYRSQAHMFAEEWPLALEWADRAIAVAEEVGAPAVRAYALVNKGTALVGLGDPADEGAALLAEARAQAERVGDMVTVTRGYTNAVFHELKAGRWAKARRLVEQGWGVADRHGLDSAAATIASLGVDVAVAEGDMAAARRWLGLARQATPAATSEGWILVFEAQLAAESGDDAAYELAATRLREEIGRHPTARNVAGAAEQALLRAARSGDADAAAAALAQLEANLPALGGTSHEVPPAASMAVLAASAGVPVAQARRFLERVAGGEDARAAGWLAHLRGLEQEAAGDPRAAAEAYREALAAPQDDRPAVVLAELALRLAACLELLGDRDGARAAAEAAVERLAGWPGVVRDRAERQLRRLSASAAAPGLLTRREAEVVALLAQGLTNRQIAERLYISVKTAAVHVSNILAKTGLSTRTEVAAWALRTGVLDERAG